MANSPSNIKALGERLRVHGPVLLFLIALVFVVFGRLCTSELWSPPDFDILYGAHRLAPNPWAMFGQLGTWFSRPLLQLAFLLEYKAFGMNLGPYVAVSLLLHAFNAFMVYMLVNMLFFKERLALVAAVLFALGVGSFGRNLLSIGGQEQLILATLHFLVLYLFIRNDFRRGGAMLSSYYVIGLVIYSLTGLTKASTLSLLGCLVAYKVFFYHARGRRSIFSNNLLLFLVLGLIFQIGQSRWGFRTPTVVQEVEGPLVYTYLSIVNVFRYLHLMVFPLQESTLLREAGDLVQAVYRARVVIRVLLTVFVLSFSFFGFVFGSRPLRFFIAWTYITLIPFGTTSPGFAWLNVMHLYLASLGFCVVLASGATGCANLLRVHRWRRYIPYAVPLIFAITAVSLTYRLDARNRAKAASEPIQELHRQTIQRMTERPVRLQETR